MNDQGQITENQTLSSNAKNLGEDLAMQMIRVKRSYQQGDETLYILNGVDF